MPDLIEVLVVDDEIDARMLLTEAMELAGYRVTPASDGNEAIGRLRESTAVVITDLMMPRQDGIGLLRHLKDRNHPSLRIVLTSFADKDRSIAALNAGADYLVEKPFSGQRMVELVRKLMSEQGDERGLDRLLEVRLAGMKLTDRDRRLVLLVLKGLPNREIAGVMDTTEQVVKNQLHVLYRRLGIASRGELFHFVFPI